MKSGLVILCLFMFLFLTACTPNPNRVQTIEGYQYSSDGSHEAAAVADTDTVTFEQEVRGHLAMPEDEQDVVRGEADKQLAEWRGFEQEAIERYDSRYKVWYHDPGTSWQQNYQGIGLGNGILALKKATAIDPSYVESWSALGRLAMAVGDRETARANFDRALLAAEVRTSFDRPVERAVQLDLYRDRAWCLRDLARWDEGLEAVHQGLLFQPGDQDLTLIRGLLLAGAGRYEEAVAVAVHMKPFRFPLYNFINMGIKLQDSAYANNWIRSQALLALGDYYGARRILGDLDRYTYIGLFRHAERYWQDTGLVGELAQDPKAALYYSLGHITRFYWGFFPLTAISLGPLVLDVPDPRMPAFSSFGNRFFAGGSYMTYIAIQMNRMSLATFPAQRMDAAGGALQALEIAENRHIQPDVCRALRGRVYYFNDDFQGARNELLAARTAFKGNDRVDPGTSLLLGMLEMQGGRHQGAARFLEEAVGEDPQLAVGWRSLGVVYDHLGLPNQALAAMDRALELEPYSVAGLYNRGLFHMHHANNEAAARDLQLANRLDPDNREVQRMLLLAGGAFPTTAGEDELDIEPLPAAEGDPEALLAGLQNQIMHYFAVADSQNVNKDEIEAVIRDLEARYVDAPDPDTRKMLALAYIDNRQFHEAQGILAGAWGIDLEPDEEVMLLYVDHMLDEQERARALAAALVTGEASGENPYAMAMVAMMIQDDPRADVSIVDQAFYKRMEYGIASSTYTDAIKYAYFMRVGFANARGSYLYDDVVLPMDMDADPFFRALNNNTEGKAPVNAGVPSSGARK